MASPSCAAICSARCWRSSEVRPASTTSPPHFRTPATFTAGAVSGTTTTARTPRGGSVLPVTRAVIGFVFFHHPRHVHHQVAGSQVHDLHALGVPPGDADPFDRHPDHDALLGDHHQLVVGQHFLERNDVAGL